MWECAGDWSATACLLVLTFSPWGVCVAVAVPRNVPVRRRRKQLSGNSLKASEVAQVVAVFVLLCCPRRRSSSPYQAPLCVPLPKDNRASFFLPSLRRWTVSNKSLVDKLRRICRGDKGRSLSLMVKLKMPRRPFSRQMPPSTRPSR